jgi:glutathione synthase/RimK-type ligase-like ATP-grasp enzyme
MNKTSATINWNTIGKECDLINHIEISQQLGNKNNLSNFIRRNKFLYKHYPFTTDRVRDIYKYKHYNFSNTYGKDIWIVKPYKAWGGSGIKLVRTRDLYKYKNKKVIIQKYLEKPLLLNGYKFDFRMYLIVTPDKKIYIHPFYEVRIAHSEYDYNLKDIENLDSHLTNLSYQTEKGYDVSDKRLSKFEFEEIFKDDLNLNFKYSKAMKATFDALKTRIQESKINSFEFFGVDVIFDINKKAYVIEFNDNPGFTYGDKKNYDLHHKLLSDIFMLTIDNTFTNSINRQNFPYPIKIRDYGKDKDDKDIYNEKQRTAFFGNLGEGKEKLFRELLEKRNFIITNKWSPKRKNHFIAGRSIHKIKWDTIVKECVLFNHMPFSHLLGNKKTFVNLLIDNNKLFKYHPFTIISDIDSNLKLYDKIYNDNKNLGKKLWLVKPSKESGGEGIKFVNVNELYKYDNSDYVIQKYLEHPLLLNGYKFDFRTYVLFSQEKKLYIHNYYEVRIAHSKYNKDDISTMDSHLTNLTYQEDKGYDVSNKRLNVYQFEKLYEKEYNKKINLVKIISKAVIKTFDAIKDKIDLINNNNFFELYGMDVILDKDINPYILEFNHHPGFGIGIGDYKHHLNLINDIFTATIDKVFNIDNKVSDNLIEIKDYNTK